MSRPLDAKLTRCKDKQPLIELESAPFNGLALRPHELRHLAQQLNALADMASRLPMGGKHFKPTKVTMEMSHG